VSEDQSKITQEEMIKMFGDAMPIEAVNLLWNTDDSKTLGDIRAELRTIAEKHKPKIEDLVAKAKNLVALLDDAEVNHGGLWSGKTMRARDDLRQELARWR